MCKYLFSLKHTVQCEKIEFRISPFSKIFLKHTRHLYEQKVVIPSKYYSLLHHLDESD